MKSQWIPVGQSMPDDEVAVLIAMPESESEPVWIGYHDGEDGWRDWGGMQVAGVTHWMHLPEPPACIDQISSVIKAGAKRKGNPHAKRSK